MSPRKAVFLDRDGTLIVEKNYLSNPEGVELMPTVIPALHKLQAAGYLLIIITNQSGIGRGYFTEADFYNVQQKLFDLLKQDGIRIDATYFCPHMPDDDCNCRKPKPGMLVQAISEHTIDPKHSYMIGDKPIDAEAGNNAGVTGILLETNLLDAVTKLLK